MVETGSKQEGDQTNKIYLKDKLGLFIATGFKMKCIEQTYYKPHLGTDIAFQ